MKKLWYCTLAPPKKKKIWGVYKGTLQQRPQYHGYVVGAVLGCYYYSADGGSAPTFW